MKTKYCEIVEAGRITNNRQFYSATGDRDGAFMLRCPQTGQRLQVIVGSGQSYAESGLEGSAWDHVSVSTPNRCPFWEEMCWIKDLFFGEDECVVQFHPPKKSYVNLHPFVLHLWRQLESLAQLPPQWCV